MKPSKKARKRPRKKRPNPGYGAKLLTATIGEMMTDSLIRQWFGSFGVLMSAGSPELKKAMLKTIGAVSLPDSSTKPMSPETGPANLSMEPETGAKAN